MDGHPPPSYSGPTQYPTNPFGYGGVQSSNRVTTMPPPRGSSLAPFPPYHQPPQYGSHNFMSGPSSPSWSMFPQSLSPSPSFGYNSPPLPMPNSYARELGGSMPASVMSRPPLPPSSSTRRRYSPASQVVNNDTTIPNSMLNLSGGSGLPPSNPHNLDISDDMVSCLNSILAQTTPVHPKPIEMPVGVRSKKRRRASNEIPPPSRMRRSVSLDGYLNGNSRVHDAPPPPPPQGVSVDVEKDNLPYEGLFTDDELIKIARDGKLKERAETNPRSLKRTFSNRDAAARSKERKDEYISRLKNEVETLRTQLDTRTAENKLLERERNELGDSWRQMKIRLDGRDEEARLRDALIKQLTGEVHRRTEEASQQKEEANRQVSRLTEEGNRQREEIGRLREELNAYRMPESEPMNEDLLEQLLNQFVQESPKTNYSFE